MLDSFLFESKLSKLGILNIFIGNTSMLNKNALAYTRNIPYDTSQNFATYIPDLQFKYNNITRKLAMLKLKDAIFINIGTHTSGTFAYLLTTLCHEMIHCYDMNFGTLAEKTLQLIECDAPMDVIDYTSHFTPCFKNKSKEMKQETGLNIRISGNDKSFEQLNKEDAKDIRRLLSETDDLTHYESFIFDDEFKKRYSGLFLFTGPDSACMIFGSN